MNFPTFIKFPLISFVAFSGLAHLLCLGVFTRFGGITFAPPVIAPVVVTVTLAGSDKIEQQIHPPSHALIETAPRRGNDKGDFADAVVSAGSDSFIKTRNADAVPKAKPEPPQESAVYSKDVIEPSSSDGEETDANAVAESAHQSTRVAVLPPLRGAHEFLSTTREKLTYRITMLGLPIGEAVIEAAREQAGFHITTSIKSNPVISAIYPVDNLVETRLINGNYLVTKIRQREGLLKSDTGFTLKFREKTAFWADRTRNLYANDPLPREDVLDFLSGFYYLRTHRLEVGKSVELYLYDSNEYAPVTVEVLRRESVTLPGSRKVDAIVVHPLLKTEGFFKRSGEVLIWLTDDENKVPVKMETTITLGHVTAELVAAESEK